MADKILYYPYWISNRAGNSHSPQCWGPPCDTVAEAKAVLRARFDAGEATFGCVVEFSKGQKRPLVTTVLPNAAQKIVKRWEDLMDATGLTA